MTPIDLRGYGRRSLLACLLALACAAPAFAQSQGRVIRDGATIWRSDASIVAAVVREGTMLEITGRSDRWFEVVVPESLGGRGERGLIAPSQVELLPGSPEPPRRRLRSGGPAESDPAETQAARVQRPRTVIPEPAIGLRAIGLAGLTMFSARESFEAVLGEPYGFTFGGGGQVRFRNGVFAQATLEQFKSTGERVFVHDGDVFPLGIPNTMTIRPLSFTGGYRFAPESTVVPYLGGGVASYQLVQETPFDDDERVDERHTGYRVLGGLEFRSHRWFAAAAEVQFTSVPDALGADGVSATFGEDDLGGFQVQVKVLVGR